MKKNFDPIHLENFWLSASNGKWISTTARDVTAAFDNMWCPQFPDITVSDYVVIAGCGGCSKDCLKTHVYGAEEAPCKLSNFYGRAWP